MDILNTIVRVMNKEEVRNFKLWLNSTNASDERKDVQLFDYIRKSEERYDENYIFRKLYGADDKNSFYRLKHRLQEDLGCHLTLLHFDKQETNNLFLYLSLYNIFISRNQPQLALYYLKKAEKRASLTENFEMLDIIYANFVRLAADLPEINPETYIEKRRQNAVKLNQIRETDQVLAAVTYRLKLSQNYGKRDVGLLKLLDNTIKEFANDDSIKRSKSFQTRVFRAVSQVLIQNHNFTELEKYMLSTYNRFVEEHWFDKTNHETKLQMLVYIINALFKNRKFRESLDYAETLGEELSAFNNMLYDKYLFFYYNALIINYAQIDINRGLKALDELEKEMKGKKNAYYEFFIYLNKANLLFFQRKTNEAIRNLIKLNMNDYYKKADKSFKLKIAVAECIMHCESGDPETTVKRVEQVKKEFKEVLDAEDFKREVFVLNLIPKLCAVGDLQSNAKLLIGVKKFVSASVKPSVEDGEILRYRSWLAPKAGIPVETLGG
ncbi:MAG: hypothetical protein KIS94_15285 [Chitinophagales bacterium]|nr:hypothetical protein [Chitinophagales bacterium]